MCKFGDKFIGCKENGIFELDKGDLDGTNPIQAFFLTHTNDFKSSFNSRVRSLYIGGEANGMMQITCITDEKEGSPATFEMKDQEQSTVKVPGNRDEAGRYRSFKVENLNGSDFSIDKIEMVPVLLNRVSSV